MDPKNPTPKPTVEPEGTPAYRCELCGGVAFKVNAKISPKTLSLFISNGPNVFAIQDVPRAIVHRCPHGGAGIAPIIGIVPDDVLAEATGSSQGPGEGEMVN